MASVKSLIVEKYVAESLAVDCLYAESLAVDCLLAENLVVDYLLAENLVVDCLLVENLVVECVAAAVAAKGSSCLLLPAVSWFQTFQDGFATSAKGVSSMFEIERSVLMKLDGIPRKP